MEGHLRTLGFPRWLRGQRIPLQCREHRLDPWVGKIPWRRKLQPTPVFLPWRIPWTEEPGGLQSMKCESRSVLSDSLWPHGLYSPPMDYTGNSPGQNTGVGRLSLTLLWNGLFTAKLQIPGFSCRLRWSRIHLWCRRCRRYHGFDPWVGKVPWRRAWQPTPVFLPWRIPWIEEPGGLQSIGSQRVRHDWGTDTFTLPFKINLSSY